MQKLNPIRARQGKARGVSSTSKHQSNRGVTAAVADSEPRASIARIRDDASWGEPASSLAALERLTGRIAHDFNNLLSTILASVDLLELQLEPNDGRLLPLREIEIAARCGAELVEQLAAYGRQQLLQPIVIDLNDVIAQLGDEIHRAVGESIGVNLRLGIEPACARLDPAQLRRVILHLVDNARDAMPDGGTLTIDVEALELRGMDPTSTSQKPVPCIMVAVTDTGVGMNETTRAHAFEPFFSTKARGSGLGLATVRGIVGQSGGALWLDSSPGEGTTVAVYFPRVAAATRSTEDDDGRRAARVTGESSILLVDDEPAVRRSLARLLEAAGFAVVSAASPMDALQIARDHTERIGMVLTDVVMPEMNGMELVDRLKESIPSLRVLYMSGHPAEALTDLEEAQRCQPLLRKPIGKTELIAAIRAVLAGQTIVPARPFRFGNPRAEVA
jgi:signal transduction histidine kinase/ActR/RegA family two-component response regulator